MTIEEVKNVINNNITTNGKNSISGSILNSVLNNIVSTMETISRDTQTDIKTKLSAVSILPFDGIIDNATIRLSTYTGNNTVYYVSRLNRFACYVDGNYYSNWHTEDGRTAEEAGYNVNQLANQNNLYIDGDNNLFAFVNGQFVKFKSGEKKYTTHAKLNKAIKELYLTDGSVIDTSTFRISVIRNNQSSLNNTKLTEIIIEDEDGNAICQCRNLIGANVADPKTPLCKFLEVNGTGIYGYIVIDWDIVEQGEWFNSNYDGIAYITNKAKYAELSPTIYAHTLNDTEL